MRWDITNNYKLRTTIIQRAPDRRRGSLIVALLLLPVACRAAGGRLTPPLQVDGAAPVRRWRRPRRR